MYAKECSMDKTVLCKCKGTLCNCVFGDCNKSVELTEENGYLVDYNEIYKGITSDKGKIHGYRVFTTGGDFVGLLCGVEGSQRIRYVEEVSLFGEGK